MQVVLYHIFYNLIQLHSTFVRNMLLTVEHHSCHIVRAHSFKHDQMSQLQVCIQDLSANFSDKQIANWMWILLSLKQFEKIWLVFNCNDEFDDINLSKNIDKWNMNLENLLKHEYEHDLIVADHSDWMKIYKII